MNGGDLGLYRWPTPGSTSAVLRLWPMTSKTTTSTDTGSELASLFGGLDAHPTA